MQEHRPWNILCPALLASALAGAPARAADCGMGEQTLEVLTYNTWGLPQPIARDRKERMPGIARMVREEDADLVGLQEVWRGALRFLDLELLRTEEAGDSGLALVTPHPVHWQRAVAFEDAWGVDGMKEKGALASRVELPALGETTVVVTHLQAGRSGPAARARGQQVDALLSLTSDQEHPAILVGDFNLHEKDPIDRRSAERLAAAGWVDVAEQSASLAPTHRNGERFDRILVRPGRQRCLSPEKVDVPDSDLSDHLPVRAQLKAGTR